MSIIKLKKEECNFLPEFLDHEGVFKMEDKQTGLKGFVAIHNNNLGPALGGTRMLSYQNEENALKDVLRLSRAMSYKCALAGVRYGGGKAVIIGDSKKDKNEDLLRSYARCIGELKGQFYTGEDVGISKKDVQEIMLSEASYFIGKKNQAEDPSPFASLSTFYSIQAAVESVFNLSSLKGLKVAVKGVGKVGGELVRLLIEVGAKVIVADIDIEALKKIEEQFSDVEIVEPDQIHKMDVDIYSPCALGDEFRDDNKTEIKAKIIAGAANNQLQDERIGDWFYQHNILYIPDYVSNAGGLIDVADELEPGGFQRERVMDRILSIKDTVKNIIELSKKNNESTNRTANKLAEEIFNK